MPVVAGRRRPGLARLHAEPARQWIVYAPRAWPAGAAPWTDLAGNRLRALPGSRDRRAPSSSLPNVDANDLDDLFYLPAVGSELVVERERWAAGLIESGTPVLIQLEPGCEVAVPGARIVYDLLRSLLAGDPAPLSALPAGAHAVWPLIPGFTDSPELWDRGCAALARAEVSGVQPLAVELTPDDRRQLTELGGEGAFEILFHGPPLSERDFARCAAGYGLAAFVSRPRGVGSPRRIRNRRLAADLALAGDLWLRLGRSVAGGQGLFRAARGADDTPRDLTGLAREGNLGILGWLDEVSVAMVEELITAGRSSLLESLLDEYLTPQDRDLSPQPPLPPT